MGINPMFQKLIEKKKKEGSASPVELKAKGSVLSELMDHLGSMAGDKVKGLKKVTVAAPDSESLAAGLAKAKSLIGEDKDSSEDMGDFESSSSEDEITPEDGDESELPSEDESSEHDELSEEKSKEDMQREIEELKLQLAQLKG